MDCIKNVQHLEYTFFLLIFVTFQLHSRTKIAAYISRLLENFKGENSLVLATRQVHLFGRKTPKLVSHMILTYLWPNEPSKYDNFINNRSLQQHF